MKTEVTAKPLIVFDYKKYRIRIHKNTLHALDDPEYVLLLVNPVDRAIVVLKSDRSDTRAHHISWSAIIRKGAFEIYSTSLLDMLKLCSGWDDRQSYRIYGTVIGNRNAVQFKIENSVDYAGTYEA